MPRDTLSPSALATILWGAIGTVGGMIAGWIAGNMVCFVFDLFVSRGNGAYAYLTWFLTAAIATTLCVLVAGERAAPPGGGRSSWINRPDAVRVAWLLMAGGVLAVTVAASIGWFLIWGDAGDDYSIPASMPHSIAFLLGCVAGLFGCRQFAAMERMA